MAIGNSLVAVVLEDLVEQMRADLHVIGPLVLAERWGEVWHRLQELEAKLHALRCRVAPRLATASAGSRGARE